MDYPTMACTYTFPGADIYNYPLIRYFHGITGELNKPPVITTSARIDGGVAIAALAPVDVDSDDLADYSKNIPPPGMMVYSGRLFWCAQTVRNVSVMPDGRSDQSTTVEALTFLEQTDWIRDPYSNDPEAMTQTYKANSTGTVFKIDNRTERFLWGFLQTVFLIDKPGSEPPGQSTHVAVDRLHLLDDVDSVLRNISQSLSNHIATVGGDNANATGLEGKAYFSVATIAVRWEWLLLPLAETVLAAALLAATMFVSRRDPLWKTSVLATLFHGLEGWASEQRGAAEGSRETDRELDKVAGSLRVRLSPGDTTRLKFLAV